MTAAIGRVGIQPLRGGLHLAPLRSAGSVVLVNCTGETAGSGAPENSVKNLRLDFEADE